MENSWRLAEKKTLSFANNNEKYSEKSIYSPYRMSESMIHEQMSFLVIRHEEEAKRIKLLQT